MSQTSVSSSDQDEVSEMMSKPILGDMVLVRRRKAITVRFVSLDNTGNIQTEQAEDIQTIVTERYIPEVRRNNALQYVSANWSSMLYISESEMLSFGGYDDIKKTPHDKVVWIDLRNLSAKELPPMKVSRFAPVIILVDEFVYVFGGGFGLPTTSTRVEAGRFHVPTKSWEDLPNMTYRKRACNPSYYQDVIYIVGGLVSMDNEAYRILQGDYIPLDMTYPFSPKQPELGFRTISYIIGNELLLLNSYFLQVYTLTPKFAYQSYESVKYPHMSLRSPVSPKIKENLVYSMALLIDPATKKHSNYFCIFNINTREFATIEVVELCPYVKLS